jgi:aspartate aminotransferase
MTGWRIGFCAGPRELIRAMVNVQGHVAAGVSSVGQAAAAAALDGPQEIVAEMAAIYKSRRDMVVAALNQIPGIACHKPEGAFYVFPNIAGCLGKTTPKGKLIESDVDFAESLLDEAYVALVPGSAFGMSPYLRISYATDDVSLTRAMTRIGAFAASLA